MGRVIAIDGPSGAGKSTLSRALAARLGFAYLDTGAMYRAVAWAVDRAGIDVVDEAAVAAFLPGLDFRAAAEDGEFKLLIDGRPVGPEIRTPRLSQLASKVSTLACVRRYLLDRQRDCGRQGDVVAEGRDMGTVVFPEAAVKIFLDAPVSVRARRRWLELRAAGETIDYDRVLAQSIERDERDSSRDLAPLRPGADAVSIDAGDMSVEEVTAAVGKVVARRLGLTWNR